jgi:putative cell wall-binding protein
MRGHAASLLLLLLLLAVCSSAASDDTDAKQQQKQQQQLPNDIVHLVTDNFADVIERQPGPALVRVAA